MTMDILSIRLEIEITALSGTVQRSSTLVDSRESGHKVVDEYFDLIDKSLDSEKK